ncbi:uncharacterized protein LOC103702144 [Phoenix dactylifera]|uniref:Uncharacterized protein LOC103702144 n=1 Tax=Phoenix dactylifera TaxID=42345 RepID=A0A8B7BPB1_PHODC|nr:uncharacterized protein LOC103702144 [Phoenix dactylifera]
MDLSRYPLDLILMPLSICLTAGYHAYLWHASNAKNPVSNVGLSMKRRKAWAQTIVDDNNKKGILGVQSLRNSLMSAILSASIAILISTSLAALSNNAYNSRLLLRHAVFGSQTGPTVALKFASSSLLLLFSFLCSSMAVWCLVEANFLINAPGELFQGQAQRMLKRGWVLGLVGSRALYVTLSILLWSFGPVPVALSSVALVWVFYNLDFINGIGSKEVLS